MQCYGLIGYPLGHSFSAKYFTQKFETLGITNAVYNNYPIESIDKFTQIINNNPNLIGLNVTIPYKQQVLQYLNKLSEGATEIGAVNCIKIVRDNNKIELIGYNTDEHGFKQSLLPYLKPNHTKALILGSGGASKAVEYVLKNLNIEFKLVSRQANGSNMLLYNQINKAILNQYHLIVNTTPLGMAPNINTAPEIPYEFLTNHHLLFDLVYNPNETLFMKMGKQNGAVVLNGLQMLQGQAERAWEIWNE